MLEITERERRRIGLDLHDDLGQKLSGIALMTKGLELKLAKQHSSEAKEAGRIHKLVQQTMSHASELAHDLATLDLKENDLPAALKYLAAHARELFEISCRFKAEAGIPSLEPNVAGQLYKIAQEAVTNAIKHGKARHVGISLANGSEHLILTVQNDGLPFPDMTGGSTGMGLRIMNYRASLIGAALEIKATKPLGTLVTCSMPMATRRRMCLACWESPGRWERGVYAASPVCNLNAPDRSRAPGTRSMKRRKRRAPPLNTYNVSTLVVECRVSFFRGQALANLLKYT